MRGKHTFPRFLLFDCIKRRTSNMFYYALLWLLSFQLLIANSSPTHTNTHIYRHLHTYIHKLSILPIDSDQLNSDSFVSILSIQTFIQLLSYTINKKLFSNQRKVLPYYYTMIKLLMLISDASTECSMN